MKNFVLFAVLFHSCSIIVVKAKSVQDCELLCPANENRPVCGSDGKTYRSKCLLRLRKCTTGTKLHVDYTGPCRAPPSCSEERTRALKSIREKGLLSVGILIPRCDSDDTYSVIQCHKSPVFCWCVDKFGRELEGSRVMGLKQPDCRARSPRSHPYPLGNDKYTRILKGCSKENRINFNKKSVAMFKKEMTKLSKKKGGKLNFVEIVQWKMQELDADKNGHLQHKEVKALIKKLKKSFSPRKCGKTLFYYCDKDKDYTISKKEWLACLGFQGSKAKTSPKPDVTKCLKARETAVKLRLKNPKRFVPSCNADGTYTTVQCEKMSKYCWCVNPITGRNIPNTAVINAKPDCTRHLNPTKATRDITIRKSSMKPRIIEEPLNTPKEVKGNPGKRMKECDEVNWTRFSNELVTVSRKELESITGAQKNSTSQGKFHLLHAISMQRLPDSMIMAWKFSQLDVDTDRLVNYRELFVSHMKKIFGGIKRGRKCSKRLFVTCDVDHNRGLSLVEWRSCLQRRRPKRKSKGKFWSFQTDSNGWCRYAFW